MTAGRVLFDHDFDDTLPDDIQWSRVLHKKSLVDVPTTILETIHLDHNRQCYWNVVLANVSSRMVLVYKDGSWCYMPFKIWARKFSEHAFRIYCKVEDIEEMERGHVYRIMLDERFKEVEQNLFVALLGSMRSTIKMHHRLR